MVKMHPSTISSHKMCSTEYHKKEVTSPQFNFPILLEHILDVRCAGGKAFMSFVGFDLVLGGMLQTRKKLIKLRVGNRIWCFSRQDAGNFILFYVVFTKNIKSVWCFYVIFVKSFDIMLYKKYNKFWQIKSAVCLCAFCRSIKLTPVQV